MTTEKVSRWKVWWIPELSESSARWRFANHRSFFVSLIYLTILIEIAQVTLWFPTFVNLPSDKLPLMAVFFSGNEACLLYFTVVFLLNSLGAHLFAKNVEKVIFDRAYSQVSIGFLVYSLAVFIRSLVVAMLLQQENIAEELKPKLLWKGSLALATVDVFLFVYMLWEYVRIRNAWEKMGKEKEQLLPEDV